MYLGAHVSISKGFTAAVKTALELKANTFQFFTRNPRGGSAKKLDDKDILTAHSLIKEHGFGPIVAHAPYTYNLASAKEGVREFSIRTIKDDLLRAKTLKVPYLVLHVGTHGGQGEETGIKLVIEGLKEILAQAPSEVEILLEGMAGEGTELGYTFFQLGTILKGCEEHPQLGICIDSCHMTGAGYDLKQLDQVKEIIKKEVGLYRVKAVHLNDSKFPLGSKRDRHAKIGEGVLGLEVIQKIVCDKDFNKLPLILETPNDNEGYAQEISLIRKMCS